MKIHQIVIEALEQQLDVSFIAPSFDFAINSIYEGILSANSDEERVALLYSIKTLCISFNIKKPNWWYTQRNRTDWINENGSCHYGYDLGGF